MNDKFILNGKIPIVEPDLIKWAQWMEIADRHVAKTIIGNVRVSTVFLGLDHSFKLGIQPILFETMIFGGEKDGYQSRYATWEQAIDGHKFACSKVFALESKVK